MQKPRIWFTNAFHYWWSQQATWTLCHKKEMQWNTWVSIIPSVDAVDVAKNFSGPPHVFLLSLGWAEEDLYTLLLLHFHTTLLCSDLQHNTQYNDIQEKYCVLYDVLSTLCIEPGKDMLFDWYTFPHFFRI